MFISSDLRDLYYYSLDLITSEIMYLGRIFTSS